MSDPLPAASGGSVMKLVMRLLITVSIVGMLVLANMPVIDAAGPGASAYEQSTSSVVYGVGTGQAVDESDVNELPSTGRGVTATDDAGSNEIPTKQTIQTVLVLAAVVSIAFGGLALVARHERL